MFYPPSENMPLDYQEHDENFEMGDGDYDQHVISIMVGQYENQVETHKSLLEALWNEIEQIESKNTFLIDKIKTWENILGFGAKVEPEPTSKLA